MLPRNLVYGLAGLAMAGILGGVFALQHYAKAEAEAQGPSVIAVGADGAVLLGARKDLFWIRPGQAIERIEAAELGLGGPFVGLGWDGKDWFVADDASGTVHRCDLAARRCSAALAPSAERWLRRTAKLAFAPDRIYVTDTERHRLLAFDGSGQPLAATRTSPIALCFPNGIRVHDSGLMIADTNNHRIAWVDPTADYASETYESVIGSPEVTRTQCSDASKHLGERGDPYLNREVDSANHGHGAVAPLYGAEDGRIWPSDLLFTKSSTVTQLWVVLAGEGMRDGNLMLFIGDEGVARVALPNHPEPPDPVQLADYGDRVLVTDPTRMRVLQVPIETATHDLTATEWEPGGLAAAFDAQRERRAMFRQWRFAATGMIGVGVLLALLVAWLERRREEAGVAPIRVDLTRKPPERVTVERRGGELIATFSPITEKLRRLMTLFTGGAMLIVAVTAGSIYLKAMQSGASTERLAYAGFHIALLFVITALSLVLLRTKTTYRVANGVLRWTSTPVNLFMWKGEISRSEIKALRLVEPPLRFATKKNLKYGLRIERVKGRPRQLMVHGDAETVEYLGATLADALGLPGLMARPRG